MVLIESDPSAGRVTDPLSHWLDAFRWMAAAAVMLAHLSAVMLPPYATIAHPGLLPKLFLFLAGFAHQAVMVFFVLSGYLVGGSFLRDVARDRVNVSRYMLKRIARLWTVIIPALGVAFALAAISIYALGNSDFGPYVALQSQRMSVGSMIGTMFFTNTWLVQPFAFDLPLWSVANEFLYYVAWPILVLGIRNWRSPKSWLMILAMIAVLASISLGQKAGSSTLPYFLPWLFGAAAARFDVRRFIRSPIPPAILLVALLLASRFVLIGGFADIWSLRLYGWDCAVAAAFAGLLTVMKTASLRLPPLAGMHAPLANCSFSLYCLHYPLTVFVASILRQGFGVGYHMPAHDGLTWTIVLGMVGSNFLFAWCFGALTEANTDRIRSAIEDIVGKRWTVLRSAEGGARLTGGRIR